MFGVQLIKTVPLFVQRADNIMMQRLNNALIVKSNCVLFVMALDCNATDVRMAIIPSNCKMEILNARRLSKSLKQLHY